MKAYRVFTVKHDRIKKGVDVRKATIAGGKVTIWAVTVGEKGRGRKLGILPVAGLPNPSTVEQNSIRIEYASIGQARSGRPKLIVADAPTTDEAAIVVLLTEPGFRGGSSHTGDRVGYEWRKWWGRWEKKIHFDPFPGKVLVGGYVAQGAAGRMGGGPQIVALVPKGKVFRAGRSGRLYGAPAAHYYVFDGKEVITATWEERELLPDEHPLAVPLLSEPEKPEEMLREEENNG